MILKNNYCTRYRWEGTPDYLDIDSDNDGIYMSEKSTNGSLIQIMMVL